MSEATYIRVGKVKAWSNKVVDSKAATRSPAKGRCAHLGEIMPDEIFPPPAGLGDYVSSGLAKLGITKERFRELVTLGRSEAGCGCEGRQKFINWIGSKLGLPKGCGPEIEKLMAVSEIKPQSVFECAVHGKCLRKLLRTDEAKDVIEKAGYKMCLACDDRKQLIEIGEITHG